MFLFLALYISWCYDDWLDDFMTAIKLSKENLSLSLDNFGKCDALRDLVPFAQFKKREKHLWRSANFSKVVGLSVELYYN